MIINRFIINLRRANRPGTLVSTMVHFSSPSAMNFRMPNIVNIVGNMGEPLEHGTMIEEEDGMWRIETAPREGVVPLDDIGFRGPNVVA